MLKYYHSINNKINLKNKIKQIVHWNVKKNGFSFIKSIILSMAKYENEVKIENPKIKIH